MIFAGKRVHAREVVDPLVGFHAVQLFDLDLVIRPKDVPFVLLIIVLRVVLGVAETHLEQSPRHVSHNMVLRLRNIEHKLLGLQLALATLLLWNFRNRCGLSNEAQLRRLPFGCVKCLHIQHSRASLCAFAYLFGDSLAHRGDFWRSVLGSATALAGQLW